VDTQIAIIVEHLSTFCEDRIIGLALDLNVNLSANTPVDLGWARANWVPSIGAPYEGGDDKKVVEAMVAGAQAAKADGEANLLGYKIEDGVIYFTNNVPYINALNAGHSRQSPPGFVQSTIAATVLFSEHSGEQAVTERSSFVYRPGR
jgi:hypothetical protein